MATILSPVPSDSAPRDDAELDVCDLESRFQLVRVLGRGGVGTVWEAVDLATEEPVALKIVRVGDSTLRRRTIREARIGRLVQHAHLLVARERFETLSGHMALVMDLLRGEDLGARLSRAGALAWTEVRALLRPIAEALAAVHAAGLVHRDVKPQNIFLANAPGGVHPWLMDFGMAKIWADLTLSSGGGTLTAENTILGTPHYMAPEQLRGETDIGPAADVWAFGVVLFECLTGTRPVEGKSFGQIFRTVSLGQWRSIRGTQSDLPEQALALVESMLKADAEARPSMYDVGEALAARMA